MVLRNNLEFYDDFSESSAPFSRLPSQHDFIIQIPCIFALGGVVCTFGCCWRAGSVTAVHAFLVSRTRESGEDLENAGSWNAGVVELKQISGILGAKPLLP